MFLTGYESNQLWVCCLDRAHGRELWRRAVPATAIERTTSMGSPACSTPVVDGTRVYVYFGSFGLASFRLDGTPEWQVPLPTPIMQHGTGTSPVLTKDHIILLCDQDTESFLLAVNRATGKTAWRTARPEFRRGFSTPLIVTNDGRELIVVGGSLKVVAYHARDGQETWRLSGLPNEMCASPVAGQGLVYVGGWTSGVGGTPMPTYDALLQQADKDQDRKISKDEATGPDAMHFPYIDADKDGFITRTEHDTIARIFTESKNALFAIDPSGHGDVTSTHARWRQTNGLPYVPTPLYYQGRLYLVKNGGFLTCLNATTGEPLYVEKKLDAGGDYYASPVAADGKIILTSRKGMVTMVKAGDAFEVMARNNLEDSILATPALVDNIIYFRLSNRVLAIGTP